MATKRIITADDWRSGHPTGIGHLPSDLYYARICTSFLAKIDEVFKLANLDDEFNEDFALMLGHYLEDVVSKTHLFDSFRKLNMKMYGKKLPFYTLGDDYLDDEVNLEDIKFLVWDHVQQLSGDGAIINPDNEMIDWIANQLFPLVCDAYEEVPEVTQLHDFIFDPKKYNDFIETKSILTWILLSNPISQPVGLWEDILEQTKSMSEKDDQMELSLLLYTAISQHLFESPCNWNAVYAKEWLAQMLETEGMEKEAKRFGDIKRTGFKHFEIVSQDDDALFLRMTDDEINAVRTADTAANSDEIFRVTKQSFADEIKNNHEFILTDLVNFDGDDWEINGSSWFITGKPEKPSKIKDGEMAYNLHFKSLGNKLIGYFKDIEDMQKRLVGDVPVTYDGNIKSNLESSDGIVAFLNSNGSLNISTTLAPTIPDPENPYFTSIDKALLIGSMFNSQVASAEMAKYFFEHGWYDEISLTSLISPQRGHDLLHDNFDFLLRYFRGREYHTS